MKSYEENFCKEVINDTSASERIIDEVFTIIMDREFGERNHIGKVRFIKNVINHTDIGHIDLLMYAIDGDSYEILELFGADYNDLSSIEETRDKWENSDLSDEIEDRIQELKDIEVN